MAFKILILVALLLLVFGKGKFSDLMGDVAKGIKSFRQGLADDEPAEPVAMKPAPAIEAHQQVPATAPAAEPARKENA
jgi:sec-independent protein translocase protein TatA